MGICNQIAFLILYSIRFRPITLLKVTDAPISVSDILDITVSFKLINFSFHIFLVFVPEMSTSYTSSIIWITYSALVWIL
jgi:hypothetical protein